MSIDETLEQIERRLQYYCWFVCIKQGKDEEVLVYVKDDGLAEKQIAKKVVKQYTNNYKIIKLAMYNPGGRNA